MRMIGSLPSFRFSRSPGLAFLGLLAVLLLAYEAAQLVLAGSLTTLAVMALVFVGMAIVVSILNDWRRGLYLLLGWVMFEDLFRKYLGNNMGVFFAKDILAVVLYVSFLIAKRKHLVKTFRPAFLVPLLIFFWYCVIQVFNPESPSIFYGLLGMKLYFLYVPLIFVGYALLETEQDLRRFFLYNSALMLVVTGLGIAQSIIGPKFLNPTVIQEDIREAAVLYRASPITGLVAYRPTSVFVSTGRFEDFLNVAWLIALGFAGYLLLRSRRGRNLAFLTLAVVGVGSVMSTSRGAFMWNLGNGLVVGAAFLWGAPWRQGEARRVLRTIQRALMAVGLAIMIMMTVFPAQVASRFAIYTETLSPTSSTSELLYRTRDYPLRNFLLAFTFDHWVSGYGIGTFSLGIQYVGRILHAPPAPTGVENGYGQLLLELGIVGLLFWIFLGTFICVSAWKITSKLRGTPFFPLSFVIFWYAFMLFGPNSYIKFISYQDYFMNLYLWLLLGILFRLPNIYQGTLAREAVSSHSLQPGRP